MRARQRLEARIDSLRSHRAGNVMPRRQGGASKTRHRDLQPSRSRIQKGLCLLLQFGAAPGRLSANENVAPGSYAGRG